MAVILGTAADEDLSSAASGDVILGLGGNDVLSATAANITLDGGSGNDQLFSSGGATLIGGPGDDVMISTGGNDTVSYADDPGGVIVDLSAGYAIDGTGGFDLFLGIANIAGSAFDDSLTGDDSANVIVGGGGNDAIAGNAGNDVFECSFDFTAGAGETFSFTQFFADHGGKVVNGEVADGTSQGQFASLYTQWLEMLMRDHGLGTGVLDLGQNSGSSGMPVIENMTGTFGDRESFEWTSGSGKKAVTHERWYSDTWSSGGGTDSVTSGDGHDTVLDFAWGEDKLSFSGITQQQFVDHFNVDASHDVNGDAQADTVITISGFNDWSVTLSGVSGHDLLDFASASVFTPAA